MEIKQIRSLSEEVGDLIALSQQYQAELYPAESVHQEQPEGLVATDVYFVGAFQNQQLVGLGAVKKLNDVAPYGEVKNLFVDPRFRGQGAARVIMQALEQYLRDSGVLLCRLETGVNQPESIALYASLGYRNCEPYGDYVADPLSVFMQKDLAHI